MLNNKIKKKIKKNKKKPLELTFQTRNSGREIGITLQKANKKKLQSLVFN